LVRARRVIRLIKENKTFFDADDKKVTQGIKKLVEELDKYTEVDCSSKYKIE